MQSTSTFMRLASCATLGALSLLAGQAHAQAVITQSSALAGNVSPGDTAGFPITLSQPGNYKLMSNLVVPAGTIGVEITSPNVTLDLNGFTIAGPVTCTRNTSTYAVTCTSSYFSARGVSINQTGGSSTVRNGTVQGFYLGIYTAAGEANVENVSARHNGYAGMVLNDGGRISDSVVELNSLYGISAMYTSMYRVTARFNGSAGISGLGLAPLYDSYAQYNGGVGVYGMTLRGVVLANNKSGNTQNVLSLGGNASSNTVF